MRLSFFLEPILRGVEQVLPFSRPSQLYLVLGNRGTHFDIHGVAIVEAIILFIPLMYPISFVAQPYLAYFLSACGSWVQLFVSLPSLVLLRSWHGPVSEVSPCSAGSSVLTVLLQYDVQRIGNR
jgi:hypothetical protein